MNGRAARVAVACVAASALLLACGGDNGNAGGTSSAGSAERNGPPAPVEVGKPAPSYAATSLTGAEVSLATLRGKPVLLNVWATWCHPCREEIPVLEALHRRWASQGLQLVGVSVDADGEQEKIRDFMAQYQMTYPVWLDPGERVSSTFLLVGVPATFIIGKDGTLLWKRMGPLRAGDAALDSAIARALQ